VAVVAAGLVTAAQAQAPNPQEAGSVTPQQAGSEPVHPNSGPTADVTAGPPIGAGPETTPAKNNEEIAARDRIPIMARPLPLDDEQKRRIVDAVGSDKAAAATQVPAGPATILPSTVELSDLPADMSDQIPALRGYKYVNLPDKVLIVSPANRVVVGEIRR
jgi:hypothetical protein